MKRLFAIALVALICSCSTKKNGSSFPSPIFITSDSTQTPTYEENISFWEQAKKSSNQISMFEIGQSDAGKPIHLITWSKEGIKNWEYIRSDARSVLFINNGIHPGEPDGIDACQLLIKEIVETPALQDKYKDCIIALIPVYNVGGALNRNSHSRANQEGPAAYGFRGNAQNLDLNRDCIKMDSKNSFALAQAFHYLDPDLFFDTHVSNGADYQHVISLLETQAQKLGGPLESFYKTEITDVLFKKMKENDGYDMIPYVNVWGRAPQDGGIYQFMDWPRYTNGLAALHHVPAYTIETHMLKPFKDRVLATLSLLKNAADLLSEKGKNVQDVRSQQKEYYANTEEHQYHWEIDSSKYEEIKFLGYDYRELPSTLNSKFKQATYNQDYPLDTIIPFYNHYKGSKSALKPRAFIIPAGYYQVAERLAAHGVSFKRIEEDTVVMVRKAKIASYETSPNAYEKHYPHYNTVLSWTEGEETILAGSYCFATGTEKDRILMETLLPDAIDSFFSWNFFDAILQQKEGYSPYVWDIKAAELLSQYPDLKKRFEEKLEEDSGFKSNLSAQQYWVYQNSMHAEKAYLDYPVRFLLP